ncbi:hypothetical protein SCHIN_v1c07360 [Spiroplasma chinense]|uniref:Transmembrane protein n=1 Tax=Spiroplasma chinense TaxID=216932 RepID=A0A5B9Y4G2_9MOLU|nr:hypothetical protein [Spiroplasma chinense]QEH61931.1 hypothetical protein SCHIN_v1c07360 [Spiroplasma chinense]
MKKIAFNLVLNVSVLTLLIIAFYVTGFGFKIIGHDVVQGIPTTKDKEIFLLSKAAFTNPYGVYVDSVSIDSGSYGYYAQVLDFSAMNMALNVIFALLAVQIALNVILMMKFSRKEIYVSIKGINIFTTFIIFSMIIIIFSTYGSQINKALSSFNQHIKDYEQDLNSETTIDKSKYYFKFGFLKSTYVTVLLFASMIVLVFWQFLVIDRTLAKVEPFKKTEKKVIVKTKIEDNGPILEVND